jgi:hypothetical protein
MWLFIIGIAEFVLAPISWTHRSASGKTSNVNLVLSQMIFDNPNNDTYFWEIISNLMNFVEKELYSAEGAAKVSDLRKHDICMSICPWIGVKLSAPLQYIATCPIARCNWSKLGIQMDTPMYLVNWYDES